MNKPYIEYASTVSFALAEEAPIGIVTHSSHGKLSRLYLWNMETDEFTPGQCVKAQTQILSISPNGRYFAYYAECFHRPIHAYLAIAKPPFFTALAFFPTLYRTGRHAMFTSDSEVEIFVEAVCRDDANEQEAEERIDPGCPLKIIRSGGGIPPARTSAYDSPRNRKLWADGNTIFQQHDGSEDVIKVISFGKNQFAAMEPPYWAQVW